MATEENGTTSGYAICSRVGHARIERKLLGYAFGAAAVSIALLAAGGAFAPQSADAKALTGAQAVKRIERSMASGKTWVKFKPSEKVARASAHKLCYRALYSSAARMLKVSGYQVCYITKSKYSTWIKLKYYSKAQRKRLKAARSEVVAAAKACKTQAQEVRAIHDSVNARCSYDYATLRSGRYTDASHNAYRCLVQGKCVCAGYATGFQLAALSAGLKSAYVSSGNHAWNIVKVNGRWYHVDCTWDDTGGAGAGEGKYFLLGSGSMAKIRDHTVKDAYPSKHSISAEDWIDPDASAASDETRGAAKGAGGAICNPADDPSRKGAAGAGGGATDSDVLESRGGI